MSTSPRFPHRWALPFVVAIGCGGQGATTTSPPVAPATESATTPAARSAHASSPPDDTPARLARIERGLIPEVRVRGEAATWTIEQRLREHHTPGVSIAIIHDHRVVAAKAYGVADAATGERLTETTLLQAASVSKVFTAFAALREVDAGKLPLESNVNDTLKSWKLPDNEFTRRAPVTLKHLLSHTAGLNVPSTIQDGHPATEIEMLEGKPPAVTPPVRVGSAPGTKFRYSGGGPTIVQQMLIDVEKRPFAEVIEELVLGPLGLVHSTFSAPVKSERWPSVAAGHDYDATNVRTRVGPWVGSAAGGLWSTPTDIARLFIEVQLGLQGKSKVVSQAMATRLTTPVMSAGQGDAIEIALGPFVERHGQGVYFGHDGLGVGFITVARASMIGGDGAVIMANGQSSTPLALEILRSVAAEYGWEGWLEPPIELARVDAAHRASLATTYGGPASESIVIAAKGDRLEAWQPYRDPIELLPLSPDEWVARADATRFTFSTDAKGTRSLVQAPPPWPPSKGTLTSTHRPDGAPPEPLQLLEAGRTDEALREAKRRQKADAKDATIQESLLGHVGEDLLHRQLDPKRAVPVLQLAVDLYPKSPMAQVNLSEALQRAGRQRDARKAYFEAKRLFARDKTMGELPRVYFLWKVSRLDVLEAFAK